MTNNEANVFTSFIYSVSKDKSQQIGLIKVYMHFDVATAPSRVVIYVLLTAQDPRFPFSVPLPSLAYTFLKIILALIDEGETHTCNI